MRGLSEAKPEGTNRRLEIAKQALREVLTAIVTKFVEQQRVNPMLAVEALFRYRSKEVKDSILSNYSDGLPNDANQLDDRMVFEDEEMQEEEQEEPEVPQPVEDKD